MHRLFLYISVVLVTLCCSCDRNTGSNVAKTVEGARAVDAIDRIAVTDQDLDDERTPEIYTVLSKESNPAMLFDHFVVFRNRLRELSAKADGKCYPCNRYGTALELTMKRLAEIRNDEAAKYLVLILEREIVGGHAHLSEKLVHYIAQTGDLALPYLRKIEGNNSLAQTAIRCIEKREPCE